MSAAVDRESLHGQVAGLGIANWHVRAILHALIDAGQIETLECQYESCIFNSRAFVARTGSRGHEKRSVVIDHIETQMQGGSDRLENLRAIHASCNVSRAERLDSPETREKRRAARAEYLASDRTAKWRAGIARRGEGWNVRQSPDDKRRGHILALTPEDVVRARAMVRDGAKMAEVAAEFKVSLSTAHNAVHGRGAYAALGPAA